MPKCPNCGETELLKLVDAGKVSLSRFSYVPSKQKHTRPTKVPIPKVRQVKTFQCLACGNRFQPRRTLVKLKNPCQIKDCPHNQRGKCKLYRYVEPTLGHCIELHLKERNEEYMKELGITT
jgi:predicted RNA-binding Zn-ribbon protein involved in translation (DUF1610 family)